VGTELLALHWVASPPTATIMFSYEITGAQQHRLHTLVSSTGPSPRGEGPVDEASYTHASLS